MKRVIFSILLLFFVSSCDRPKSGCTKDTDCKGDRVCENGKCVNNERGKLTSLTSTKAPNNSTSSNTPQQNTPSSPVPTLPMAQNQDPFNQIITQSIKEMIKQMGKQSFRAGNDVYSMEVVDIGNNGELFIKVCLNKKCEKVDFSKPDAPQKIIKMFSLNTTDPSVRQILQSFSMIARQLQGVMALHNHVTMNPSISNIPIPQIPNLNPTPIPSNPPKTQPFVQAPTRSNKKVYHSWQEIQLDGDAAKGGTAIIHGLKVVKVTDSLIDFTDKKGNMFQLLLPKEMNSLKINIAKTTNLINVTFSISLVRKNIVRGIIKSIEFTQ